VEHSDNGLGQSPWDQAEQSEPWSAAEGGDWGGTELSVTGEAVAHPEVPVLAALAGGFLLAKVIGFLAGDE
jgi:hypothetical protein